MSSLVTAQPQKGFIPHALFQYYSRLQQEAIVMLFSDTDKRLLWSSLAEGLASA